jgi:hypothetical protein
MANEQFFLATCEQHPGKDCYHIFDTVRQQAGGEPFCIVAHCTYQEAERIVKTGDITGCLTEPFRLIAHLWRIDHRGCYTLYEARVFDEANGYFINEFEHAPLADKEQLFALLRQKYPEVEIVDTQEWNRRLGQYDIREILSHSDWRSPYLCQDCGGELRYWSDPWFFEKRAQSEGPYRIDFLCIQCKRAFFANAKSNEGITHPFKLLPGNDWAALTRSME